MSSLTGASPPGPPTTTGAFLGRASLGVRMLTQVVAPITAQKSVAHTRETRATLAHRSLNRSSSALRNTDYWLLLRVYHIALQSSRPNGFPLLQLTSHLCNAFL